MSGQNWNKPQYKGRGGSFIGRRGGGRFNNNNRPQCQLCHRFGHLVQMCYYRFDDTFSGYDDKDNQASGYRNNTDRYENDNNYGRYNDNGNGGSNYNNSGRYNDNGGSGYNNSGRYDDNEGNTCRFHEHGYGDVRQNAAFANNRQRVVNNCVFNNDSEGVRNRIGYKL